jgi:LytS/YehU family sensor histidine kinase
MFFFYKATKENEENKLRNKALETERSLLRTQMNPHFIFNALNSVQNYIISNNAQEAVRFLSKFAKLMRMILNNSMVQMVTLSDELQSLSLYLDLERARFGNKFSYSIDVSDEVEEDIVSVPPMLIQPFIENAIIHGLMHKTDGEGLITVSISENDRDSLVCRITDNGIGRKAAAEVEKNVGRKHKSVGMQLTRDRLRDLNSEANAKLSCVIDDLEDEAGHALGTRVTIVIPMV